MRLFPAFRAVIFLLGFLLRYIGVPYGHISILSNAQIKANQTSTRIPSVGKSGSREDGYMATGFTMLTDAYECVAQLPV